VSVGCRKLHNLRVGCSTHRRGDELDTKLLLETWSEKSLSRPRSRCEGDLKEEPTAVVTTPHVVCSNPPGSVCLCVRVTPSCAGTYLSMSRSFTQGVIRNVQKLYRILKCAYEMEYARGPKASELKKILRKQRVRVWIGFICLRTGLVVGFCEHGNEPFGYCKGRTKPC
jgi:hypothetical protein